MSKIEKSFSQRAKMLSNVERNLVRQVARVGIEKIERHGMGKAITKRG